MRFDIITIFPELFKNFAEQSLLARAQKKDLLQIQAHNLRDWTDDAHHTVDDKPFGGGVGMVMKVEPIMKAVQDLKGVTDHNTTLARSCVILFSPRGKKFNQKKARELSSYQQLIFICGRYEGIDERVGKYIADEVVSVGDYVVFGGEVPAMIVVEAVSRLLPGVIAKEESATKDDHPQYTRPEILEINGKKRRVPEVLLRGDHEKIKQWRERHM